MTQKHYNFRRRECEDCRYANAGRALNKCHYCVQSSNYESRNSNEVILWLAIALCISVLISVGLYFHIL